MEQLAKNKRRIQIVFWLAVISSWLTFLFFFSIPLGLIFWIAALIFLFANKTKLRWYLLLASSWTLVPIMSFVSGSKHYFQGKATIKAVGLPNSEFYNLDRGLRVWHSTSGCIVIGFEPFTQVPNNWAVLFWTKLLGTQKGVYKGVYPTREQAEEIIRKGEQVSFSRSADTFFITSGNQQLFFQTHNYNDLTVLKNTLAAKMAVLNNECLLVEPLGDTTKRLILLADKSNGKVFARYVNLGPGKKE